MAKRNIKKVISLLAAVSIAASQLVFSATIASAVNFNAPVFIEAGSIELGEMTAGKTESFDELTGKFNISFDMTVTEDSNIADNGFTLTFNKSGASTKANGILRLGAYTPSSKTYAVEWFQGNSSTSIDRLGNIEVGKKYTYTITFDNVGTGNGASATINIKGEDGTVVANNITVSCRSYTNDNTAKGYGLEEAVFTLTARDSEAKPSVLIDSFNLFKALDITEINVKVDSATVVDEVVADDGSVEIKKTDEVNLLLEADGNKPFYVPSAGATFSLSHDLDNEVVYGIKENIGGISIRNNTIVVQPTAPENTTAFTLTASIKGSDTAAEMKLSINKEAATQEDIVASTYDSLKIKDTDGKESNARDTLTTTKDLVLQESDEFVDIVWECLVKKNGEWRASDIIDTATGKYTVTSGFDGEARLVAAITSKADSSVKAEKTFTVNISHPDEQIALDKEYLENYMEDYDEVTSSFDLPIIGDYGSVITWTSSNPSVISTKGEVKRATSDKTVTLTATIENGGQKEEVKFKVLVEQKKSSSNSSGSTSSGSGTRSYTTYKSSTPITSTNNVVTPPIAMNNTPGGANTINNTPTQQSPSLLKFYDLGSADWAAEAINALADKGIINGKAANTFAPMDNVTRAEFAKILISALDITDPNANADALTDVDKSAWYYNFVASAFAKGIITGYDNGAFGVNDNISRQDMAVLIYRAAKAVNITLPETAAAVDYADANAIDEYAKEAVTALQKAGIINGVSATEFAPKATASRAAAAKMIYGILNLK